MKQKQVSLEKDELEGLFQKQGKYHSYMRSCVEQSAKQALVLLGMQGFVIYDSQANNTKPFLGPPVHNYGKYILPYGYEDVFDIFPDSEDVVYNISYAITKPVIDIGMQSHPNVPDYPFGKTKLVSEPMLFNPIYKNTLGNSLSNPITPLCDYHGGNRANITGAIFSCENYDSKNVNDHNSIQEYVEAYVSQHTKECVRFEDMPELDNLSVEKGNVTTEVVYTQESVHVSTSFSIEIARGTYMAVIEVESLDVDLEVRLKKLYELFVRLIEKEINDIFFDIQGHAQTVTGCKDLITGRQTFCLKDGMKVYKYTDVCLSSGLCSEGKYDDVLVIEDSESLINGKSYLIFAAIENRVPALDLVRQEEEMEPGYEAYDYYIDIEDDPYLRIYPYGYDPDEDSHIPHGYMGGDYTYGGWLEDYEEICISPSQCVDMNADAIDRNTGDYFHLTSSTEYVSTGRNASYDLTQNDLGPHVTKVQVCDNEGLCDHQELWIFVTNCSVSNDCPLQVGIIT